MFAYAIGGSEALFWIVLVVALLAGAVLVKMLVR